MTFAAFFAWAFSVSLTPLAAALAWKCDAVSKPDGHRKLHPRPTPLWGGVSLYVALLAGLAGGWLFASGLGASWSLPIALALSAGMLCLLGAWDDLTELSAGRKLAGQVVATLPVVLAGFYVERVELLGCTLHLGWVGIVATMAWLLLCINAMNLIDGMDGLASTVGILISAAVAVVAGLYGLADVMLATLALAAALAGFLLYNRPPARIYLGDSGSMVVGGVLGVLVLRASTGGTATPNLTIAAALFFLPLLDTFLAIVRRSIEGRSLMDADRGHAHHRLLDRGLRVWQVLGVLGGLCALSGAVASLTAASGQELLAWTILPAVAALAVRRQLIGHEEWRLAREWLAALATPQSAHGRALAPPHRLRVVGPPPGGRARDGARRAHAALGEPAPIESSKSAA
jgi:UDP-GlcNAc:undecaprenyl-phosphate/decaprenyl-phosphate GlcNAc-1-phosphate transferase